LQKVPVDFFSFRDLNKNFDYYTPVIFGNNTFMDKHPDVVKKFLQATEKGYKFAIDNPDKAANILLKQVPELDKKLVKRSQKWLSKQYMAEEKRWGYIDPTRW